MKLQSSNDIFEKWLDDIKKFEPGTKEHDLYPFFVRVGCVKMAPPRHERFQYFLEFGVHLIDSVFDGSPIVKGDSGVLTFVFPERYMSVHEQRTFPFVLEKHPDAKKIERVDFLTSSPLLIGNFHKDTIRILTWDDDEKYNGEKQF